MERKEIVKLNEESIQIALGNHYGRESGMIAVPNVLMYSKDGGMYEADFITITKSGYLTEVEVKISISDFRADFEKQRYHDSPHVNSLYYALPKELYQKHKEEIDNSCNKVGAGIILIRSDSWWDGIVKKPKLRKVKPLTIYEKLDYARLGCMKWPKYYYRGMNSHG